MGAFDSSIGAFVVGGILACYLTGITSSQCFTYYTSFPSDRRVYKWTVGGLLVLDLFHTAISSYTVYYWGVTSFGDLSVLGKSPWSFTIEPFMTGVAAAVVQIFYAYRVYVVGGRKLWVPLLILLCSAVQFGFAMGATIKIFLLGQVFASFSSWTYGVTTWLITAAATDVFITSSLIYYLRKATGGEHQHLNTKSLVERILRNTIETNGLTCVVAIIDAIIFIASPNTLYHVIPQLMLLKLYFNSLLVSLNSRKNTATQLGSGSHNFGIKSGEPTTTFKRGGLGGQSNHVVPIRVTMQETVHTEVGDEKELAYSRAVTSRRNDVELTTLQLSKPVLREEERDW